MKTSALFWTVGCALLLLCLPAPADTFTLSPTEDAFIASSTPNNSYGTAGQLSVSANKTKGEFSSLLKFNFSSAIANFDSIFGAGLWTVQYITLTLTNTAPNNAFFNGNGEGPSGTNINFSGQFTFKWMQNDGWVQGSGSPGSGGTDGVTYNSLPGLLVAGTETLGTYNYTAATSGTNIWTLGLTPGFLADARAGNSVSLLAQAAPGETNLSFGVNSQNFGTPANRPVLTITAVPEPGASPLLGVTLLGWLSRRRRHAPSA